MGRPVAAQLAYTARTSTVMVSQASGAVQPSRIEPAISAIATLTRSGTTNPYETRDSLLDAPAVLVPGFRQ